MIATLVFCGCDTPSPAADAPNVRPAVVASRDAVLIPQPMKIIAQSGQFVLTPKTVLCADGTSASAGCCEKQLRQ